MEKKGIAWDVARQILIGAVLFTVLLIIYLFISSNQKTYADDTICKDSINRNAYGRIKILGSDISEASPITCTTQYKKVTSSEPEMIKAYIAEEMNHCWDLYGREGLEIFDTSTETYCVVWSRLEF